MHFSSYQNVKQTTILIFLILGGTYCEGMFIREGTYFENLTFGGSLIRECALIRSFMVVRDDKSVYDII